MLINIFNIITITLSYRMKLGGGGGIETDFEKD